MGLLKRESIDGFIIVYRQGLIEPQAIIDQLRNPLDTIQGGRGEIKILSEHNNLLACRKYIHGGLFRGITGDIFFSEKRAAAELEIMIFLEKQGFPVVRPCGYISKKNNLWTKNLYLLTFFEEKACDFLEFIGSSRPNERLRALRNLARLFCEMGKLGVYHPDLHFQNVLVTKTKGLLLLDFDKAYKKTIRQKDFQNMLWRLNRFAEKKEKSGKLIFTLKEKIFFLRTVERISGYHLIEDMEKQQARKQHSHALGWFFESLFYPKTTR